MLDKPERDALGRGAAEWSIQWRWLFIPLTVLAVIAVSYSTVRFSVAIRQGELGDSLSRESRNDTLARLRAFSALA